jgi:hypothetical protein
MANIPIGSNAISVCVCVYLCIPNFEKLNLSTHFHGTYYEPNAIGNYTLIVRFTFVLSAITTFQSLHQSTKFLQALIRK